MSSLPESNPDPDPIGSRGLPLIKQDIRALHRDEIARFLQETFQPAYREEQLLAWVHREKVESWDQMTSLPKTLRGRLAEAFDLVPISLARRQGSSDTTQKFLWRLRDGSWIESVLIPANPSLYGEASDRHTLCVSTQVGCAYGCKFCASGLDGWRRNLTPDEIVGQVYAVENLHAKESVAQSLADSMRNPKTRQQFATNALLQDAPLFDADIGYERLVQLLRRESSG